MPTPPEPRPDQPPDRLPEQLPEQPDGRAHGLGPHVVGRRIVVRRVLRGETGPSGGPALTDLLGVCLAWADGVCLVQPESGPPVRIATADIVSGKPVPPRPSTRLRLSPDAVQRRAMALFEDLQTESLGGWTLRWSPTHGARRARSVLAVEPSGLPAAAAYDATLAFYAAHHARPIAAVLPDSAEEELFRARGWGPESGDADTVFAVGGVAAVRRRLPRVGIDADDLEVHVAGHVGTAAHPVRGLAGLTGTGVVDGDWIGLRGIHVPAHLRRQGLGPQVVSVLLEWGAERGATTAYLQVLGDNAPALRLYEGLGFVEHHRYRYLAAPAGPGAEPSSG